MTPGGGGPETPFLGSRGDPPHPPREGGRGGTPPEGGAAPPPGGYPPTPPGGGTPPSPGGGKPRPKRTPPWVPFSGNQIRVKKLREGKRVIDFLHTLPYLVSVDYYVENYTYHSDVFSSSSFIFLSSEISD
jgi:hypothetical protein